MDWFKYYKRKGTPRKSGSFSGGDCITWMYNLNIPGVQSEGFIPEMQIQVFENGFTTTVQGLTVRPLEFRLSMLFVPREIGFNAATGILMPEELFQQNDKVNWWTYMPKEELSRFLDQHRHEIYPCFMKTIFEYI